MTPTELISEARELRREFEATEEPVRECENCIVNQIVDMNHALCDELEQAQATLEQTWEWDMYQCAQREIDRLRKKLEAAQNSQRWIPVAERLPEVEGFVLAVVNGKPKPNIKLCGACMLAEYSKNDGWILEMWPAWKEAEVTHWQPLPQAPKGECE